MPGPIANIGNRKAVDASGHGERCSKVPVPPWLYCTNLCVGVESAQTGRLASRNEWITHSQPGCSSCSCAVGQRLISVEQATPVFLLDLLACLGELTLLLVPIAGHASTTRHGGRTTLTRVSW